jgi:hypothetical protein
MTTGPARHAPLEPPQGGELPVLRKLACPRCGAAIPQFNAQAQTLTCRSCNATLTEGRNGLTPGPDAQLPPARIPINVGQTLPLDGASQIVLGRVRYRGWEWPDTSEQWTWDEWLIGRPDGRLSWLVHDEHGLSLYTKVRQWGPFDVKHGATIPLGDRRQVPVSERYPAEVLGVEGELTSRIVAGDQLFAVEGRSGATRCSVEATEHELECTCGRVLTKAEVTAAFGSKAAETVHPPRSIMFHVAVMLLVMAVLGLGGAAAVALAGRGDLVASESLHDITTTSPQQIQFEVDHPGRPVQIEMTLLSDLPVDTYSDIEVEATAPDGSDDLVALPDFWHETGIDEGVRWEESKKVVKSLFVPAQQGTHTLSLQVDSGGALDSADVQITVHAPYTWPMPWLIFAGVAGVAGVLSLFAAKPEFLKNFTDED